MIAWNSIVQIMDVKKDIIHDANIQNIFNIYKEYAFNTFHGETIRVPSDTLKIRDLQGWTNIKKIELKRVNIKNDPVRLMSIEGEGIKPLLVTSNQPIPIYREDEDAHWINGESKYLVKLDCIQFWYGTTIRYLRRTSDDVFIESEIVRIHRKKNHIVPCYRIETESGFFNANDIHLISNIEEFLTFRKIYK